MKVFIGKRASKQIHQIFDWYEDEQTHLGHKFLDDFDLTIGTIQSFPNAGINSNRNTRRMILRKFPFKVFYRVYQKKIVILAVFHHHRKTKKY